MKRRCVFLDRDGVINVKPPDGEYVRNWSEFVFIPGIAQWIRLLNALDYLIIVVTNQRGVARGLVRAEDLEIIHRNMRDELAARGAHLDDIFVCPHENGACACRKPQPGLVSLAQRKWNIHLGQSCLIGDSEIDRQLARNCGLSFIHVQHGRVVDFDRLKRRRFKMLHRSECGATMEES